MGTLGETFTLMMHMSGFIIIGADIFLPFTELEKVVTFVIGLLLVYMVWLK